MLDAFVACTAPRRAASVSAELARDLVKEIHRIGFHSFVLVRIGSDPASRRSVYCQHQNVIPEFVDGLAQVPRFGEGLLVRGIEHALRQEIYDAGDLLFRWMRGEGEIAEMVHICEPDGRRIEALYNYPVFAFDCGEAPSSNDRRIEALAEMLDIYASTEGNNARRFSIMAAAALALGRALGARGDYDRALAAVDKGLAVDPYSIHLTAAKHTLLLKSEGKHVAPRLEKFAGEDNGYLRRFVCPVPFERFAISPDGEVSVCCGHWLPTSIGNFLKQPVNEILNSPTAQKIRQSVTDGSYKYCDHLKCALMTQQVLTEIGAIKSPPARKAVSEQKYEVDGITDLFFAFDQTCNLSCPSCRTHVITEKVSQSIDKARAVEEKLLSLLPTVRILNINSAGELFVSKSSRKFLELINDERCPDLRLDIISNGTLFNREEWNKFPGIHKKIQSVRISIDAATKETFEKLRRLGKYDLFIRNMQFLRELRDGGSIPELKFSFTYQLENFREMKAFIHFCDEMHADFAVFDRLHNGAFSREEFRQKAVHYPDHPLYSEFIEVIKDPIFSSWRVWHDFDYDGVENMSREKARKRFPIS
jgi:MoaA/NifB/PqqE/SkfB family radical SAM enzyme